MENEKNFSNYVAGFYNKLNKSKDSSYGEWKWFRTKSARTQYNQTKKSILKVLDKKYKKALEIGPGDGIWTMLLSNFCSEIHGIDVSEEMLKLAKKRLQNKKVKLTHSDFLEAKIEENSYDLVYSIRCLEYIQDKEAAIKKIHKTLKKGGNLIIVTKNPYFIKIKKEDPKLHSKQIPIDKLAQLIKNSGFEIKNILPAVMGKGFHFPILRQLSNSQHKNEINKPISYKSLKVKYLSESFLIFAEKK